MKFSEKWLRQWIPVEASSEEIIDKLTMAGLEVEGTQSTNAQFTGVIVATVVELEPHPQSKKLKIAQVNIGTNNLVQVVCGANNVEVGIKVPFAQVGAKLPGDITIGKASLKSVDSFGMLCASDELGLEEKSSGLFILDQDAQLGMNMDDYLELHNDNIIDIGLTPNRGDCLSIMGLACEMGAIFNMETTKPYEDATINRTTDSFNIVVEDPVACPSFFGCLILNVNVNVATPIWMQEKLRRSGIRSIDPIVDITNYVMLEQGQPLHGYDLAKLTKQLHIRMANAGEKLELLDGNIIDLTTNNLVIADAEKVLALAGIMGGKDSGINSKTTDVFLESAFFTPEIIAGKARSYGMHTEASHRFERGVDFTLQQQALDRATQLIISICGGQAGKITSVVSDTNLPKRNNISLRVDKLNAVIGLEIDKNYIKNTLHHLGCSVTITSNLPTVYNVIPPSWRFDLTIEADLIEEIARLHGYNNIPNKIGSTEFNFSENNNIHDNSSKYNHLLISRGYYEVISYSFIDSKLADICNPDADKLYIANPIASDQNIMRNSLIPGLLKTAKYNFNRQQTNLKLFETGQIFATFNDKVAGLHFAMLITGKEQTSNFDKTNKQVDFYTLKQDVHLLLKSGNQQAKIKYLPANHPTMHPKQCAIIMINNTAIGYIGALHPSIAKQLQVSEKIFIAELNYQSVICEKSTNYKPISKYPEVKRDLAFIIANSITSQQLIDCIETVASDKLKKCKIFDIYSGAGIEDGHKSIAISLFFQDQHRTLEDTEINSDIENIVLQANKTLNAKLRDN